MSLIVTLWALYGRVTSFFRRFRGICTPGRKARERGRKTRNTRKAVFKHKKARPDRPGIKKPAHTGPAVLDPIFNIPGVRDRAASARDNTNARECPQPTQRSGVPGPVCKGVAMVFFPSHIVYLHYLKIFSPIQSQAAAIMQNIKTGLYSNRKPSINVILFTYIKKPQRSPGPLFHFIKFLHNRQIMPAGKYSIKKIAQYIIGYGLPSCTCRPG